MKSIEIGYQHDTIKHYRKIKSGSKNNPFTYAVEGFWSFEKIMTTTSKITTVIYCQEMIHQHMEKEMLNTLIHHADHHYKVSCKTMNRINSKNSQALIMICENQPYKKKIEKVIVLDGLENPGNIGTIFRSSDGAGFDAVFVVNQKATINQCKIVKASMGGYFNIPWYNFDTIEECMKMISKHKLKLVLANPAGPEDQKKYNKLALVVGSERHGLSKEWFDHKHDCISIPMKGCCDSLNVGVAASILMYKIGVL